MRIAKNVTELIGGTPLVEFQRVTAGVSARIVGKLEASNPANSVKDRIGLAMIEAAERDGLAQPGRTVLVEPTSGNTGIALAFVAAARGYACVVVMPESFSPERRVTLRAFGAKLVLTPASKGMRGAVERANEIADELPNAFIPQQFRKPREPGGAPHHDRAGDLGRHGRRCRRSGGRRVVRAARSPASRRPSSRASRSSRRSRSSRSSRPCSPGGSPGPHRIQGIGAGFVPDVLDRDLLDRVITVSDESALTMARRLAREEGLLCGISAGANVAAAIEYSERSREPRQADRDDPARLRRALPANGALRPLPLPRAATR